LTNLNPYGKLENNHNTRIKPIFPIALIFVLFAEQSAFVEFAM